MKKFVILILVCMASIGICACKNSEPNNMTEPEMQLSPLDEQLFGYIHSFSDDWEIAPNSAVKIINIGNYSERSKNDPMTSNYGPDTVVVHLQAEKSNGDIISRKIQFCLTTTKNETSKVREWMERYDNAFRLSGALSGHSPEEMYERERYVMEYEGTAGDWTFYEGSISSSDDFNIALMNDKLKEYWTEHWTALGL